MKKPEFLIIGVQKCGTTWLWEMLKQHPGTDLPERKEIHSFGSAELYRNGKDWYYSHFQNIAPSRVTGDENIEFPWYSYLPMKGDQEELLGRSLDCRDYGSRR